MSPGEKIKKDEWLTAFQFGNFGGKKDILNKAVQVDKESRHGCISQANFKSFYFVFQSLPEVHGDTLLFYTSPL